MTSYVLGINSYHPDSSAAIFKNGELRYAIEEERFSRIKHHSGFPYYAIKNCLEQENIDLSELDAVTVNKQVFSNIFNKINYVLKNVLNKNNYDKSYKSLNFGKRLQNDFIKYFNKDISKKLYYVDHHVSHLLSSYYTSNFENSNLLSIDGFGDFASINFAYIDQNGLKILKKTLYPHSLGIFYQSITQLLGFPDYGDEYKVMGMSAFGSKYLNKKFDEIISYDKKRFINLDLNFFDFYKNTNLFDTYLSKPNFKNLFSKNLENHLCKQRSIDADITDIHYDIAYSAQKKYEEISIEIIKEIKGYNFSQNMCVSGGCANNSAANGKYYEIFKNINFSYSSSDSGGAIGSAMFYITKKKSTIDRKSVISPYLGIKHNVNDFLQKIDLQKYKVERFNDYKLLIKQIAISLSNNKVVALYRDRSEFGPRALGNRSILANPSHEGIKEILNSKIKKREPFRPFAPSILKSHQDEFFGIDKDIPYMTEVLKIKKSKEKEIKGAVHVDGTCRLQSISKELNPFYYELIKEFYKLTKIPVLLNTSFNINEPIVESPKDALDCFERSEIDMLILDNNIIIKNDLSIT